MNKSDTIIQITSDVLDRYRSSIPRKAFTRAMEQVIELVLDSATAQTRPASPGLALIRSSDMDVENLAQMLCGACPPFPAEFWDGSCHECACEECWQSWLTAGRPLWSGRRNTP